MQCSMNKPKKMKFPFSLFLSLSLINAFVRFTHAHGTFCFSSLWFYLKAYTLGDY